MSKVEQQTIGDAGEGRANEEAVSRYVESVMRTTPQSSYKAPDTGSKHLPGLTIEGGGSPSCDLGQNDASRSNSGSSRDESAVVHHSGQAGDQSNETLEAERTQGSTSEQGGGEENRGGGGLKSGSEDIDTKESAENSSKSGSGKPQSGSSNAPTEGN